MATDTPPFNVLFACSEITPLIKTGGLADVCGSLPHALRRADNDVRVIIPGYESVLDQINAPVFQSTVDLPLGTVAICSTRLAELEVLLVTHPCFSNRPGNPYMSDNDRAWPDNPLRFALFSQAIVEISQNRAQLNWQPDIVHCHDWQTGLVPALLELSGKRPATVFTVHNLAYQGNIMQSVYTELNLPPALFHDNGLEFWGQASFIKGGLAYADRVNTVSIGYASEITTPAFGNGMEGILRSRGDRLSGILNGIDINDWNPATDPYLPQNYNAQTLDKKSSNKTALQELMGLPVDTSLPVLGVISRLAEQKGIDILIDAISAMANERFQLVVLGSGETSLQLKLESLQHRLPGKVSVKIGFNESWSRLIESGSDIFLMPSRYEPCGLNQMYSLRYGTLPVVTNVGGLADTVTDCDKNPETANGFVIEAATSAALEAGIGRALTVYQDKSRWRTLQQNGMALNFSWDASAARYHELYARAHDDQAHRAGAGINPQA